MTEENMGQEFRLKEKYEKRKYFIGEIKQIELISKNDKKFYKILNYYENLLILASAVTGCVPISAFASLVGIPVVPVYTESSVATIKIFAITLGNKKYQSLIKKKKHDNIELLAKTESNNVAVLISKALID